MSAEADVPTPTPSAPDAPRDAAAPTSTVASRVCTARFHESLLVLCGGARADGQRAADLEGRLHRAGEARKAAEAETARLERLLRREEARRQEAEGRCAAQAKALEDGAPSGCEAEGETQRTRTSVRVGLCQ